MAESSWHLDITISHEQLLPLPSAVEQDLWTQRANEHLPLGPGNSLPFPKDWRRLSFPTDATQGCFYDTQEVGLILGTPLNRTSPSNIIEKIPVWEIK